MKKTYYLFNAGRISRKDNTLSFTPVDEHGIESQTRYIPIETVDNFYCFGSLDANSALYNFLGKNHVSVHFFDYLLAGKMQIQQTKHYWFMTSHRQRRREERWLDKGVIDLERMATDNVL